MVPASLSEAGTMRVCRTRNGSRDQVGHEIEIETRTVPERLGEMLIERTSEYSSGAVLRRTAGARPERRPRLDDFDRALLDFVIQWRRYGGPPDEETLPLFGIRERDVPQRIQTIASVWLTQDIRLEDRLRIVRAVAAVQSVLGTKPQGAQTD